MFFWYSQRWTDNFFLLMAKILTKLLFLMIVLAALMKISISNGLWKAHCIIIISLFFIFIVLRNHSFQNRLCILLKRASLWALLLPVLRRWQPKHQFIYRRWWSLKALYFVFILLIVRPFLRRSLLLNRSILLVFRRPSPLRWRPFSSLTHWSSSQ